MLKENLAVGVFNNGIVVWSMTKEFEERIWELIAPTYDYNGEYDFEAYDGLRLARKQAGLKD